MGLLYSSLRVARAVGWEAGLLRLVPGFVMGSLPSKLSFECQVIPVLLSVKQVVLLILRLDSLMGARFQRAL